MDDVIMISIAKLATVLEEWAIGPALGSEENARKMAHAAAIEVAWHPIRKKKPNVGQHIFVARVQIVKTEPPVDGIDGTFSFEYHPAVVDEDGHGDLLVWPDDVEGCCSIDEYDLWCRRFLHRPPPATQAVLEHALRLREQDAD